MAERQQQLDRSLKKFDQEDELWATVRSRLEAELVGALPPPGAPAGAQAPIKPRKVAAPWSSVITTEVLSRSSQLASPSDLAHARDEGLLKQGFLFRVDMTTSTFLSFRRRRCWHRLFKGKMFFLDADAGTSGSSDALDPKLCCDLRECTVHRGATGGLPFCFGIVLPDGHRHKFQAENEDELAKWISAIRRCKQYASIGSGSADGAGGADDASVSTCADEASGQCTLPVDELVDEANRPALEAFMQANPSCAECASVEIEWVSTSIGCSLCVDCASVHRRLGTDVSRLRSLFFDKFSPLLLRYLIASAGNERANAIWEAAIPNGWHKPRPTRSASARYPGVLTAPHDARASRAAPPTRRSSGSRRSTRGSASSRTSRARATSNACHATCAPPRTRATSRGWRGATHTRARRLGLIPKTAARRRCTSRSARATRAA